MIIHHSGKDKNKGARGHSSLRAAVDTEIEIKVDGDRFLTRVLSQERDAHACRVQLWISTKLIHLLN